MSGTVSTRWFWSDWMSDAGLRACSYAARGLWKDLLCIAGANKHEYGFVSLNGRKLDIPAIAQMTNGSVAEVQPLLAELELNGVFSRDKRGVIYCRRMVRAEKNRRNGRLGGNPNLTKSKDNPIPVEPKPKALIPEPEPKPKEREDSRSVATATRPSVEKIFDDQFWKSYPRREGSNPKEPARKVFLRAVKSGADPAAIVDAAKRYAAAEMKLGHVGTPYVAQAVTWLRQSRWSDYTEAPPPNGTPAHLIAPPGCESLEEYRARFERENSNGQAERTSVGGNARVGQNGAHRSAELQLSGGGALRSGGREAQPPTPDD